MINEQLFNEILLFLNSESYSFNQELDSILTSTLTNQASNDSVSVLPRASEIEGASYSQKRELMIKHIGQFANLEQINNCIKNLDYSDLSNLYAAAEERDSEILQAIVKEMNTKIEEAVSLVSNLNSGASTNTQPSTNTSPRSTNLGRSRPQSPIDDSEGELAGNDQPQNGRGIIPFRPSDDSRRIYNQVIAQDRLHLN